MNREAREEIVFRLLNRAIFSRPKAAHPRFTPVFTSGKPSGFLKLLSFFLFAAALLTRQSPLTSATIENNPDILAQMRSSVCDGTCNCPDCPVFFERLTARAEPFSKEKLAVLEGFVSGRNGLLPADLSLPPIALAKITARQDARYLMGSAVSAGVPSTENHAVFVF